MLFAASLLALTLAAAPSQTCTAPTQTGVYRITATTKDSSNASVGLVLLEKVNDCLEASIIAADGGPAIIEQASIKDNTLTGRVHMRYGFAQISLNIASDEITGSIVNGKKSWIVRGRRTTRLDREST